jgi:hypothetical protein
LGLAVSLVSGPLNVSVTLCHFLSSPLICPADETWLQTTVNNIKQTAHHSIFKCLNIRHSLSENIDDFLPEYTARQDGLNCKFVITAGLEYKEVAAVTIRVLPVTFLEKCPTIRYLN